MIDRLNIPGWITTKVSESAQRIIIEAKCAQSAEHCPNCGVFGHWYRWGSAAQSRVDRPDGGKPVKVKFKRQRFKCRSCEETFFVDLPGIDDEHEMTVRCRWYIEDQWLKRDRMPFKDIAEDVGVHDRTVRRIAMKVIRDRNRGYRVRAPEVLGIDELHLLGGFRAILVDLTDKSRTLDLLESRSKEAVAMWLSRLKDKHRIRLVAMDMWRPYFRVVSDNLPNAHIVIDKFHVQRLATDSPHTLLPLRPYGCGTHCDWPFIIRSLVGLTT